MSRRGSQQGGNLYGGEGSGNKHITVVRDIHILDLLQSSLHYTYIPLVLVYLVYRTQQLCLYLHVLNSSFIHEQCTCIESSKFNYTIYVVNNIVVIDFNAFGKKMKCDNENSQK